MRKLLFVILIGIFLITTIKADERQPNWQLVVYTNSTVAYCHVMIDEEEASGGDLLGAFVQEECRGISSVFIYNGLSYAVMNIQGDTVETINFLVWDASENEICEVEETIQSWPGHDLGYPPDFLEISAVSSGGNENQIPAIELPVQIQFINLEEYFFDIRQYIWDDDDYLRVSWAGNEEINIQITSPAWSQVNYGSFTNVYGFVNINDEDVPLDYEAGVFVNGECRCVANLQSYNGRSFLSATVQGTAIELMQFKVKNPETSQVWVCSELISTNPGGNVGYPTYLEINCDFENLEGELLFSCDEEWSGSEEVVFTVDDHYNEPVSDTLLVTVFSGNHAPELELPESVELNEDESGEFDFSQYACDEDGDNLTLELAEPAVQIEAEINGLEVTFSAMENWHGSEVLEFVLTDEEGLEASDEIEVIFLPVNDDPVLMLPEIINWEEDSEYHFDLGQYVYDIEGDMLTVDWQENENIIIEESEINWEPVEYAQTMTVYGQVFIEGESLAADDIIGAFVGDECRGTGCRWGSTNYTNFNAYTSEPETMYFMIMDVSENIIYAVDLEVETIPGGIIGYPPNFLPIFGEGTVTNMNFVFTSQPDWYGETELVVSVDDGNREEVTGTLNVEVSGVNDLPQADLIDYLQIDQNDEVELDLTDDIYDPDGDDLYIECEHDVLNITVNGLTITINTEGVEAGLYELEVEIFDGTGEITVMIEVEVIEYNQEPELELPDEIAFDEDTQYILNWSEYAYDADEDTLSISWQGNQNIFLEYINEEEILITAASNWNGSEVVEFEVTDGVAAVQDTILISVNAVNDAPQFIGSDEIEFDEDSTYGLNPDEYWEDIDTEILEYSAYSEVLEILVIEDMWVLQAPENWNGSTSLEFIAFDGEYTEVQIINVEVIPVNDAPWLAFPDEIEFLEDEAWQGELTDFSGDVDGDVLEYAAESEILTIEFSGGMCQITAPADWNGMEEIVIYASDQQSRIEVLQQITVNVAAVNDPPVIILPESAEIIAGESIELDLEEYCSDIDSEELSLSAISTEHVSITIDGFMVELIAVENWQGTEQVVFELSDGEYIASDTMLVEVIFAGVDIAINLPGMFSFAEDESLEVNLDEYIINPLQSALEIDLAGLQDVMVEIDGTILNLTASENWNGEEEMTITVTNLQTGNSAFDLVDIVVEAVNDAPILDLPELISLDEDTSIFYSFSSACYDIDSSQLYFSVTGAHPGLNIQVQGFNALIWGAVNYFGEQYVTFELSDGELTALDSMLIQVNPVNDPPVINLPNRFYLYEDESVTIDMSNYILEVDNDELILSVTGNQEVAAEIDGLDITFSASENWSGSETITITVDDGTGRLTGSDDVQIRVLPVNDAPLIELPEEFTLQEDGSLQIELALYCQDIEDDALSYLVSIDEIDHQIQQGILTLTPSENYFGSQVLQVCCSDEEQTSCDSAFVVVEPVNDPPEFDLPANITGLEDESIYLDLAEYAEDIDNTYLEYTAENDILTLNLNNSELEIIPPANWHGSTDIHLTVSDGELIDEGILTVIIQPVNDPPEIDLPAEISWEEDNTYQLDLAEYCSDLDLDQLVFSGSGEQISVNINGSVANLVPSANWNGSEIIYFTVNDQQNRATASDSLLAVVNPVNDAPVLELPEEFIFYEDNQLIEDFSSYCSDVDNTDLTLELNQPADTIIVEIEELSVTFSAPEDWSGSETLEFVLSDGELNAIDQVLVSVIDVGDEPQLNLPNNFTFAEDTVFNRNFTSFIQNPDSYDLELSVSGNINLEVNIIDYQVQLIPNENWNGSEELFFHLENIEHDIFVTDSIMVNVTPVNDPPVLALPPVVNGIEDESIELDLSAYGSDPENDELSWSASSDEMQFELMGSLLTMWFPADQNGEAEIEVTLSDGSLTDSGILTAIFDPVNDPPWLNLPDDESFAEDSSLFLDLALYSGDIDGDELSWTAASGELNIEQTGSELLISAPADWFGEAELFAAVSDGIERITVTDTMQISVTPVNDPPEFDLPDSISFNEDEEYILDLNDYAFDIDGDELILTVCRSELILEQEGMLIYISAPANWNGTENLEVCLSDGEAEACDEMIVNVLPVNDPPEFELPGSIDFPEDSAYSLDVSEYCSDIDGDELSMTAISDSLIVDWTGLMLEISAPADWNGEAEIEITIFDNAGGEATGILPVMVEAVNDAPTLVLPEFFSFDEDESLLIDLGQYSDDVDEDELFYSITSEIIISELAGALLTLSAPENWNGSEVIAVEVSDSQARLSASVLTTINVLPVNDPPEMNLPEELSFVEDSQLTSDFSQFCHDIDSPILLLELSEPAQNIEVTIIGLEVTFISDPDWFGNELLQFSLSDLEYSVTDEINIEVLPEIDEPVFELPPEMFMLEDESANFELGQYITNPETVEYELVTSQYEHIQLEIDQFEVTVIPEDDWFGSIYLEFQLVNTVYNITVTAETQLFVQPVNDPPWLDLPEEIELVQSESIQLDINQYAGDIDSDSLSVTVEAEDIDFVIEGMLVTLMAPENWSGNTQVNISISDGEYQISDTIIVTVIANLITHSYDLVQNWNWISFNTLPADNSVAAVLAPLQGIASQIKGQNISSTWFAGYGWLGQLNSLEAGKMYLLQMNEAFNGFTVTGVPADADLPLPLTIDWNWLGHLPQQPVPVPVLLDPLVPNAQQIKAQNISSTWFEGYGWLGQLFDLEPGVGYKLKMTESDTLYFPQQPEDFRKFSPQSENIRLPVTGYEHNMILIAELNDADLLISDITEIACYDAEDNYRATGSYLPELELWYFTICGNLEGEDLHFRLHTANGEDTEIITNIHFIANGITGSPQEPFVLQPAVNVTDNQIPALNSLGQSFPNPASFGQRYSQIIVPYSLAEAQKVSLCVYNLRGQRIISLIDQYQPAGSYSCHWDGRAENGEPVSSGIYFYRLQTSVFNQQHKLLIVR